MNNEDYLSFTWEYFATVTHEAIALTFSSALKLVTASSSSDNRAETVTGEKIW